MRRFSWRSVSALIALFAAVGMVVFFAFGADSLQGSGDDDELEIVQRAIERAAVQCYALEGCYPPNVDYLEDNYGVAFDHDKFFVDYRIYASNIMPDITVFKSLG